MRNPMFRFRAGVCAVLISPLVVACASHRVAVRDTPSERAERPPREPREGREPRQHAPQFLQRSTIAPRGGDDDEFEER